MTENTGVPKYPKGASSVDAVYTEPVDVEDIGNIFIEALPDPLKKEEIGKKYYRMLDFTPARGMEHRVLQKSQIRKFNSKFRLPLPFHEKLEEDFRDSLVRAYRERGNAIQKSSRKIVVGDECVEQTLTFRQVLGPDIENGISILGESSSGKSCSMTMVLEDYPQVIRHKTEDGEVTQILYISVTTEINSDMKALYDSMALAIDEALGNVNTRIYSRQCEKLVSVSKKAGYVKELIKLFNIGAIILDEIQNFTVNQIAENSFKSIVKLMNETKTALFSIGTDESFDRLYDKPYMMRRAGRVIDVSEFCETNPKRCRMNAKWIMSNQWFDDPIQITEDMIDFMCSVTCNVIGLMIRLWTTISIAYIESDPRPEVNLGFFKKVVLENDVLLFAQSYEARKNNPMRNIDFTVEGWPLLPSLKAEEPALPVPDAVTELEELRFCSPQNMKRYGFSNPELAASVLRRVMRNLEENGLKYNYETVTGVMLKVMEKRGAPTEEMELVQKTLTAIKAKPSDGRRTKSKHRGLADNVDLSSMATNL